jgi:deoxycytidine triphosphate deaminase
MVVWSGKHVAQFVRQPPEIKINPNGVDLKASEIWLIRADAVSVLNGKTRATIPEKEKVLPDADGFYNLHQGTYEVRVANEVSIPKNAVGKLYPRSSLNRLGSIKSDTAIWDSGYCGFGTQTLHVPIKLLRVQKDEFWFQLAMEDGEESDEQYSGHWQGEKPK